VKIPAAALRNILSARALDVTTLAERSGVPASLLRNTLEGDGDLDDDQITAIADQLAVPERALFAHEALPLFPPVDFRTATPRIGEFERGTLKAISFVEQLSSTFASIGMELNLDASLAPISTDYSAKEAAALAEKWRSEWGIEDAEQLEWQDANRLYVSLRSFIEERGVLVLHRSFESDEAAGIYVRVAGGPHTIVVNTTRSSKARKLFTLAHEFCHVLLRQEGASNPSVLRNRIERFCNHFAACLLAPKKLIQAALNRFGYTPSADDDFIRLFAKKLGISQEATFLRLVESGHLTQQQYVAWKAKFKGLVPPGDTGEGQGGGQSNPLQTKRTMYGSALLGLLAKARRLGQMDEIDVYRVSGLKPHFQEQLFGIA